MSVADVTEMERRLSQHDQSFDAPVGEEDNEFAPAYYLEDKSSDVARLIENENWENHAAQKLAEALSDLDMRSQEIIRARWLSAKKVTLQELADTYQVSPERIRQLEQAALKKVRVLLEPHLS